MKNRMKDIYPLILESFSKNLSFSFPNSGTSMQPMLHTNDIVTIEKISAPVKKGDIVLFQRPNGSFVLHRIRKIKNKQYFIVGDHQVKLEQVEGQQLIGILVEYKKKNRVYRLSGIRYIIYKQLVKSRMIRFIFSKFV